MVNTHMPLEDVVSDDDEGGLSRRRFLGIGLATIGSLALDMPSYAQDDIWEKAGEKDTYKQRALENIIKENPDLQKNIQHFYAVAVEETDKKTRDAWAFLHGGKELKVYNAQAAKNLRKTLKDYAEAYAALKKVKAEAAYQTFIAQIISLAESDEADVWLDPWLWGHTPEKGKENLKPIGIVPAHFFTDKKYGKIADRMSRLGDYLPQKAKDMQDNLPISALWTDNRNRISMLFTIVKDKMWEALLQARWYKAQGEPIVAGKRKVSDAYAKSIADEWQNSAGFKYLVEQHMGRSEDAHLAKDPEIKKGLEDSMGFSWHFTCLPFEGKIIKYDPEVVKKYKFEDK